ncbi:transcriptional regulator [Streptantibioticus rubrisoli]|uniref:Transcriptional regulator n=1 Tax=Streptantibioticus rubrisoli TaxID=1387313 RepID=A0ABT1P538_9ACTN|nr:transcriptional regulator [Streptantibioticus rubrisoli]MCQ4040476.1 transcriptional regulator [Streptantibioticus rubrisoli]
MTPRTASIPLPRRRRRTGSLPTSTFQAALSELCGRRATGALVGPAGGVYLVDGAVVHAESPFAPDVETLLAAGPEPAEPTGARPHATSLVTSGERELCQLTALLDAAYFALPQDRVPLDFRTGQLPRLAAVHVLSADSLREAVGRRRALLHQVWPWPEVDTAAVTQRLEPPGEDRRLAARAPRQRAVLAAADGLRTPPEIARLLRRSAFGTLLDVRQLAATGLIETPGRRADPPSAPDPPVVDRPPPPPSRGEPPHDLSDPDVALLLRLRAALEARL